MAAPETAAPAGERQSFLSHLEELRTRLVRASLALLVGFGVCYWQVQPIFHWLVRRCAWWRRTRRWSCSS